MLRPALLLAALASLWIGGWLLLNLAVVRWWSEVQWAGRRGSIVVWITPVAPAPPTYMASQP